MWDRGRSVIFERALNFEDMEEIKVFTTISVEVWIISNVELNLKKSKRLDLVHKIAVRYDHKD